MNRTQKWLMIASLIAGAAATTTTALADEGRGGGQAWGGRQDRQDRGQLSDADRNDSRNRGDNRGGYRGDNRGDNRGENRGENRGTAPARTWAGPPRWTTAPDRDHGDRGVSHDQRGDWRGDYRRDNGHDYSHGYYSANRYPEPRYNYDYQDYGRGYGRSQDSRHRWGRGESLPYGYYDRSHWERDYSRYNLYDPREGCGWVRNDNDALLVVLATGFVLDAVYDIYR